MMDLSRVVVLANGKGGVGKTSLVGNLAGEFARAGVRVLVVDLDPQANLRQDFGAIEHPADDDGDSIFEAAMGQKPLTVVKGLREGLDWIPGGQRLNWLVQLAPLKQAGEIEAAWRSALAHVIDEGGYDLVLVDTPPSNRALQLMALAAARWIVVPIGSDLASIVGVEVLGPLVGTTKRDLNPDLDWLGMVLFRHLSTATRVRQTVLDDLAARDLAIPLLETSIRASESTAQACRRKGLLVHEVVSSSPTAQERLTALRARRTDPSVVVPDSSSSTAVALAEDYAALANEITQFIQAAEAAA
jgi:cellulose biosynthesis protein BcsQ